MLDILVQSRRDRQAAERFLRQVVDGVGYESRVVITDNLANYLLAIRNVLPNGYVVNTSFSVNSPHPASVKPQELIPNQMAPTIGDRLSPAA